MSQNEKATISAGPPVTVDPQDPLPESNWVFRRWFVFGGEIVRLAMLAWILTIVGQVALSDGGAAVDKLYRLAKWLILLSLVDRVLYLIAPSAEQATKMFATVAAWRSGISTSTRSEVSTPNVTASASTTTGPAMGGVDPAQPIAPAPPQPHDAAGAGKAPTVDLSKE